MYEGPTPSVSVVMPVFNASRFLARCLDALVAQTRAVDHEVLVVDNNSTDDSLAVARTFESNGSVRILRESQQGSYAARNAGVRAARGRIVAFLDPDCVVYPGWLEAIEKAFAEVPEVADSDPHSSRDDRPRQSVQVVLGKRHFPNSNRALDLLCEYDSVVADWVFNGTRAECYFGYTNNMAVRRSCFDQLGFYREIPRGADTTFVQNVVTTMGCDAVRYRPQIAVCHLEITDTGQFFAKRRIYGASNEGTRQLGSARPLSAVDRLRVFGRTVRTSRLGPVSALYLLGLLGWGVLFYEMGRWQVRLTKRRERW